MAIGKARYVEVTTNPSFPVQTFEVSDGIPEAAKPRATGDVPYQRVIRRLNFNLPDSDAVNFMPGGGLKLVELAPNVQPPFPGVPPKFA